MVAACCHGLGDHVSVKPIVQETLLNVYDGIALENVYKASILSAPTLIEKDLDYSYVTARLLLHTIARVTGKRVQSGRHGLCHPRGIPTFSARRRTS